MVTVDLKNVVGYINDIDIDRNICTLIMEKNNNMYDEILKLKSDLSVGVKAIGCTNYSIDGPTICEIQKIICFQLLYDNNKNTIEDMVNKINNISKDMIYKFNNRETVTKFRTDIDELICRYSKQWNESNPGEEVQIRFIYGENNDSNIIKGELDITGPGEKKFKSYLKNIL